MFDDSARQPLNRSNNSVAAGFSLQELDQDQLLDLYEEIRRHLPPIQLAKMNVEEELLIQFHKVKKLQTEVIDDNGFAPNQKAQVANTVGSCLERITKMQEEIYDSERFKRIESLVVRMLRKVPKEVAEEFIADYEAAGLAIGLS